MIEKTKQWNFMKTIPNLVSTLRYVAHGILAGLLLVIEISSNIAFSICIYLNSDNTPLTKYIAFTTKRIFFSIFSSNFLTEY